MLDRLLALHSRLQMTITLTLLVCALWGVVSFLRGGAGRGLLAALAVAELLIVAEVLIGLLLLFNVERPGRLALHIIYGGVAAACLPSVYLLHRRRPDRWEPLVYAAACLFLIGVAFRSYVTGG